MTDSLRQWSDDMRKLCLFAMVFASACDGSTAPPPQIFPNVAGMYVVRGQATQGDPSRFAGTVTLTQASLASGTVLGSGTITGHFLAGLTVTVTDETIVASVTPDGAFSMSLSDANGRWSFSAAVSTSGFRDGTSNLLITDDGEIPGTWSADRTE